MYIFVIVMENEWSQTSMLEIEYVEFFNVTQIQKQKEVFLSVGVSGRNKMSAVSTTLVNKMWKKLNFSIIGVLPGLMLRLLKQNTRSVLGQTPECWVADHEGTLFDL